MHGAPQGAMSCDATYDIARAGLRFVLLSPRGSLLSPRATHNDGPPGLIDIFLSWADSCSGQCQLVVDSVVYIIVDCSLCGSGCGCHTTVQI